MCFREYVDYVCPHSFLVVQLVDLQLTLLCVCPWVQQRPGTDSPLEVDTVLTYSSGMPPRARSAILSMPSFCFLRVTISPCVRLYRLHVLNRCCPAWHVCSWLSVMSLPDYPPAYAVRPLTVLSALWCSAHHAGDQIGLYETMYCPQIHMFYAIADTNAEVIRVERHVRELNAGICFLLCVSVRSWCLSQVHRHHLSVKV